ncbi:MAG: alpha/beta fold hydrolase [Eubacteriales bacterium]|nr:alpha/beta fold hydrolase [Eubacteriales bacterium]
MQRKIISGLKQTGQKMFLLFITIAALLLTFQAKVCVRAALLPTSEEALEEDARSVAEAMREGAFDKVTEKFDDRMAAALDEKKLKESWDSVTAMVGGFVEEVSAEGAWQDGYYAVEVLSRYEKNGLLVRVVYDEDEKIAGLLITFADPGEQEDEKGAGEAESSALDGRSDIAEEEVEVIADTSMPLNGTLTLPEEAAEQKPAEDDARQKQQEEAAEDDAGQKQQEDAAEQQPETVSKIPAVILVHGSGVSDRDEEILGNKPFADIAYGLAKRGIAVLRYDKRHYVYPENAQELGTALTLREETLDDVDAAIRLMEEDARIDQNRIFVLGHSLGGMLTPAIAAEHPKLAGVISMAGSLRPLWEILYDQIQEAIASEDEESLTAEEKTLFEEQKRQAGEDIRVLRGDFSDLPEDTMLLGIAVGYWKSLKEYQGMNFIDEVTMPMLILQGDADFQVYPDKDYRLWQDTLKDRDNVTFHLYEGLNHLMMPTQGKRDISEYAAKSHVSDQVLDDIAEFVQNN